VGRDARHILGAASMCVCAAQSPARLEEEGKGGQNDATGERICRKEIRGVEAWEKEVEKASSCSFIAFGIRGKGRGASVWRRSEGGGVIGLGN